MPWHSAQFEEWPSGSSRPPVSERTGSRDRLYSQWLGFESGWRRTSELQMPPFDSIGANEYIVDVVHDAVDFISTVDTPAVWELNIWYHTLNCGFRTRISGETDFPCIYGERVRLGRIYVKMAAGSLDFDAWAAGLRVGRPYVGDGKVIC